MLYSRHQVLHAHRVLPCVFGTSRRDAGDAAVPRRQASAPRRHRVLPDGRLLRDVLRGRADRGARARADADLAGEGRAAAAAIPMCGVPFHAADGYIARLVAQGLPRRDLRAGRGPAQGQGARPARGRRGSSRPARSPTPAISTRASRRSWWRIAPAERRRPWLGARAASTSPPVSSRAAEYHRRRRPQALGRRARRAAAARAPRRRRVRAIARRSCNGSRPGDAA